jgi:hypothetical protein
MVKKVQIQKDLEEVVYTSTDDELEIPPKPITEDVPKEEIKKPKKKINLTDEQREQRRMQMLKCREKKMENARLRQEQRAKEKEVEQEYLEKKVLLKAEKIKKKFEKIDNLLDKAGKRKKKPIVEDDEDEGETDNEMDELPPEPVKKTRAKRQYKPRVKQDIEVLPPQPIVVEKPVIRWL